MLSYIILLFFLVWILELYFRDQPTLGPILIFLVLSPYINFAGGRYDSAYLAVIAIWIGIAIKNKGIIRLHKSKSLFQYFVLILLVYLIYFISWIVFNRNNAAEMLTIYAGIAKSILIMQACYEMNRAISAASLRRELLKMLTVIILLNTVMIALQRIDLNLGLKLIQALQNNDSYTYALDCVKWGSFDRCFGAMPYPMQLAIFSLFAHIFLVFGDTIPRTKLRIALIILNIICGFFAASKTFIVGFAALLLLQVIFQFYFKRISVKSLVAFGSIVALLLICIVFFDQIYTLLAEHIGGNYARYWGFLKNASGVFTSRYSSSAEYLSYMPEFLKQYWLFGVGPVSIATEGVLDSAPYVILHSGGVVALIAIAYYYVFHLVKSVQKRDMLTFMAITFILITGTGFQTWIASDASTWVLMSIFMLTECRLCQTPLAGAKEKE